MTSSDEEPALTINLNINLNGISNRTDGVEIIDDSEEDITRARGGAGLHWGR